MPLDIITLAAGLAAALAVLLTAYMKRKKEGEHAEEDPLERYAHGEIGVSEFAESAARTNIRGISRTFGKGGSMKVKAYNKLGQDVWKYETNDPDEVERLMDIRGLSRYGIHPERPRGKHKR